MTSQTLRFSNRKGKEAQPCFSLGTHKNLGRYSGRKTRSWQRIGFGPAGLVPWGIVLFAIRVGSLHSNWGKDA